MTQPWQTAIELAEQRIPYLHEGRTLAGLDCAGFLVYLGLAHGVEVQDLGIYAREPRGGILRQWLIKNLGDARACELPAELLINDVVLLQLPGQAEEGHLGLIVPHPYGLGLVHAYASVKRVAYHRLASRRLAQIRGVWSWPAKV